MTMHKKAKKNITRAKEEAIIRRNMVSAIYLFSAFFRLLENTLGPHLRHARLYQVGIFGSISLGFLRHSRLVKTGIRQKKTH